MPPSSFSPIYILFSAASLGVLVVIFVDGGINMPLVGQVVYRVFDIRGGMPPLRRHLRHDVVHVDAGTGIRYVGGVSGWDGKANVRSRERERERGMAWRERSEHKRESGGGGGRIKGVRKPIGSGKSDADERGRKQGARWGVGK